MHRLATIVFVLSIAAVAACGSSDSDLSTAPETTPSSVVSTTATSEPGGSSEPVLVRDQDYSTVGDGSLDIHRPAGAGPFPAVVLVHGYSQSKANMASLALALADEGLLVYNVDVATEVPFDATLAEIGCAVRFAHATAAEHGGDPDHLTLVGNSAGATAGLILGLSDDDLGDGCVVDEPAQLDAVVGYEGPYDWATTVYGPIDLPAVESTDPERWAAADPYTYLGGNPDLVVRLLHGDDSNVAWYEIPRSVSVEMHQELVEAGYDADITLVDGADHVAITGSGTEAFDATVARVVEVAGG